MSNLEDAWDELHAATPPGWYVGQPSYHDERNEWLTYAFDPGAGHDGQAQPGVDGDRADRGSRRP